MFSFLAGPFGATLGAPNIAPVINPPVITTTGIPTGYIGTAYPSTTLTATGATPITWSVSPSSANLLPSGLTLSSGGVISGTPSAAFSGNITFRATNTFGSNDKELTLSVIDGSALTPAVVTSTIADVTAYRSLSIPLEGSGLLPISWSIVGGVGPNRSLKETDWTGGGLPAGMVLDQFTGQLRGGPSAPVNGASFTVRVTNSAGTATKTLTLNAVDPNTGLPSFVTQILPRGRVYAVYGDPDYGGFYDQRFIYVDGKRPITYSIVGGSLPPGVTLSSVGLFGGRPTTAGTYNFTVRATNSVGSVDKAYTIEIVARASLLPVITTSKIPDMAVGSQVLWHNTMYVASGATTPITWSTLSNSDPFRSLPAGLSINSSTGAITGTTSAAAGRYRFTVQADNSAGYDRAEIVMTVNAVPTAPSANLSVPTVAVWNELSS